MKISVVIPAYNEERLLERCLQSLQQQLRMADEIIVVDNNSTDKTAAIARKYHAKVIKETKQGIMPAVYTGMSAAAGDIIARCDADSILPADWLRTIEDELQRNPNAAGITGPGKFYDTNILVAGLANIWYMYAYFFFVGSALANWPLFGSNCAIRKSTWENIQTKVHRDQMAMHDDIDVSVHISPKNAIIFKRSLVVGVSSRSLHYSGLYHRYKKGFFSLIHHWPDEAPWRRWKVRLTK